jgi:ABC-type glycerol-3-phosphate transport system permease component
MQGRMNPVATFLFASLILIFTGRPFILSLVGSVVPDRILMDSSKGLFSEGLNFDTYRYIFTGQFPDAYLAENANAAMISDAARQVPQSLLNSGIIALSSMTLNLLLGAPAAFVFARYMFPARSSPSCS